MCGRYTLRNRPDLIERHYEIVERPAFQPIQLRFNIAPTQYVAAVREGDLGRELTQFKWGLIPSWSKDAKIAYSTINARAETAAEKPAFRAAFKRRRCLIPADGFFEWQKITPKKKQPFFIHLKSDQVFSFAGLWETWYGGNEIVESCTILTTSPNRLMASLHDRMPVIVPPDQYNLWLDRRVEDPRRLAPLLVPYNADEMEAYEVSAAVNKPSHDEPDCIAPLA